MIREIDTRELAKRIGRGEKLNLIDVRKPAEFNAGHVPGAVNIPLDTLAAAEIPAGPGPVIFICQAGVRSWKACEIAVARGLAEVFSVSDGTQGWIDNGRPCE